jgi:hypothetical protein
MTAATEHGIGDERKGLVADASERATPCSKGPGQSPNPVPRSMLELDASGRV